MQTAIIFFSSGTTSLPKATEQSHLNVTSTLQSSLHWGIYNLGKPCLTPVPFFHVAGGIVRFPFLAGWLDDLGLTLTVVGSIIFDFFVHRIAC